MDFIFVIDGLKFKAKIKTAKIREKWREKFKEKHEKRNLKSCLGLIWHSRDNSFRKIF